MGRLLSVQVEAVVSHQHSNLAVVSVGYLSLIMIIKKCPVFHLCCYSRCDLQSKISVTMLLLKLWRLKVGKAKKSRIVPDAETIWNTWKHTMHYSALYKLRPCFGKHIERPDWLLQHDNGQSWVLLVSTCLHIHSVLQPMPLYQIIAAKCILSQHYLWNWLWGQK